MIVKNIEAKVRLATFLSAGSFILAVVIVLIVSLFAYKQVADARKSVYVLDANSVPLLARQTDLQMNRAAEYRSHVNLFHSLFFSLTPDDKYIEYQMKRAMYLVDESGALQYNNLKEKGFFNSILSSSAVLTLQTDSIFIDEGLKYFRYYGRQKIDRRSSTIIRSLVTEGYLKDLKIRSDNNPHAVLITRWKTLENKDIENVQKNSF
ncbi:conjugative transposon protein TraK [Pedobacter gandavensis]|uniref:Conjugative transposon TraK protein n=2 Tax=Pedobacter TaxID=84567 RepID=A0A318UES7_9SPHI|nr:MULTISPECIES: conjugative transposon protein TraK [Pedobacter]PYF74593.1 conjugative transposon TraK protein [Pedobacter nutrimenti]WGQ09061.1 conjugative transposon protein TraK [Pedobacter gandavensis]SHG06214.1 Bacteroides conjugative transposon TraK protein [Pedobacter caeni]